MQTFVISMSIVGLVVGCMFASMEGGIYLIFSAVILCIATWYFFILRPKNNIRQMLRWKGETMGVVKTNHPGGMIEVDGRSIYRERYVEYQFEHLGKTYTSTCVDAVFDVGGTTQPILSQHTKSLINATASIILTVSPINRYNQIDPYDPNEPADIKERKIHNTIKVGDKVTVYYDTNNPINSTLVRRKNIPSDFIIRCVALIIFLLLMHVLLFMNW